MSKRKRIGSLAITLTLSVIACGRRQGTASAAADIPGRCAGTPVLCGGNEPLSEPFRNRYPALSNRYRLRGVHYFQGRWPYTFWDSLRAEQLDADFREIRSYGFNTIVLFLGWGTFQMRMSPPAYDETNFKKLDLVIEAARRNDLWVVLRVGTPEAVPSDLPGSGPYQIPDLMFEPKQIDALADLFVTVSKRVARYDNVFGLFDSWEDFSQYLTLIRQDAKTRLEFENRKGLFRTYLKNQHPLEFWNEKWGTSYRRFEEIPLPAMEEPALADYVNMIAEYVNRAILSKIHTTQNVGLGYELRLDKEPVKIAGKVTWQGYEKGFQLPPQFTFTAAYYNPAWGAPNPGGFISPEFASTMTRQLLHEIQSHSNNLPIFVEQLNLADDTPLFTRTNPKLRYSADEAEAAVRILPILFRRTIGYSLWTFRDYVGNVIADSSFLSNRNVWTASRAITYARRQDGGREALLVPGQRLEQAIAEYFNPGKNSNSLYRFDLTGSIATQGAAAPAKVELTVISPDGKRADKEIIVLPGAPRRYSVLLPEIGTTTSSLRIRIEAPPQNEAAIQISEVRLWNHLMATGVIDDEGRPRRSRVEAYEQQNQSWSCVERGQAIPAQYPSASRAESCVDCSGVFQDGWAGGVTTLPVYVPFSTSEITLEAYLPESVSGQEAPQLEVRWMDAPLDSRGTVRQIKTGLNAISISSGGAISNLGDRILLVRANRTFRVSNDLRDLAFRVVRFGNLSTKSLAFGEPTDGDFVAAIPEPTANRLKVHGRLDGVSTFSLTVEPRGHVPQEFTLEQPGGFDIEVPLWSERLAGKAEVFFRVRRIKGIGHLRIISLRGENERTPNEVYR